jgi:probable F420-dependent oxidoreductase
VWPWAPTSAILIAAGSPIASGTVKIRIGVGLGTRTRAGDADTFLAIVEAIERLRFDSLWLSERINAEAPDPLIGLAVAAGATRRLKLGMSVLVLPGRNPVLLAKQLATLDRLSKGRLLPAFGLGVADPREQQAFGVDRSERAARFDEGLALIRRLWTEDSVSHHGRYHDVEDVNVRPKPVQQPPDVWLGGRAPSELRRAGRLGDGWLPSFCTPEDVAAGLPVIGAEAERHGRAIDPEHIGALVLYRDGPLPDDVAAVLTQRLRGRGGGDGRALAAVVPTSLDALRAQIEQFVAVGASKFVVAPLSEPSSPAAWEDELGRLAAAVLPLEN